MAQPQFASGSKGNDIWAIAASKLKKHERLSINFSCDNKLAILSELREVAENSRQQCDSKKWKYTRSSGETVVVRELLGNVIKWVDLFKQVGDTVVQYDPGHAALPWAGVRFLLQFAVNDMQKHAFVVEGASTISQMICRHAVFEQLYLQNDTPASRELKDALVDLYADIMVYFSKATAYFESNSAKRVIKSGLIGKASFEDQLNSIVKREALVYQCSNLVRAETQNNQHESLMTLLYQINGPIVRMSDQLRDIKDHLESSKRRDILDWISMQPCSQHHDEMRKDVVKGTGVWLLNDPTFKNWKDASMSAILWLHGIPGSGKSKLASIVIEDRFQSFRNGESHAPAFFYCSRNPTEPERSSPEKILSGIVRQLSRFDVGCSLLPPVIQKYNSRMAADWSTLPLSIEESCELIIALTEFYPMTIIVLDALDECDAERRSVLLDSLERILQESVQLVKIFVTSRDDQDIVWSLANYPNLRISSTRNSQDISAFVKNEVDILVRSGKLLRYSSAKEKLKVLIIESIIREAHGMFRWASLQLHMLKGMGTEAIKERLGKLPPTLKKLYEEVHEKLVQHSSITEQALTRNVLVWLLCSQQTLKSKDFIAMISITSSQFLTDVSHDQILHLCCDFVVYDSELDVFRFAHLSVREFFEERPDYSISLMNAVVCQSCLLVLVTATPHPAVLEFLWNNGLLDGYTKMSLERPKLSPSLVDFDELQAWSYTMYATIYWPVHCQLAGDAVSCGLLKSLTKFFLTGNIDSTWPYNVWYSSLSRDWISIIDIDRELGEKLLASGPDPLLATCAFDLAEIAKQKLPVMRSALANIETSEGTYIIYVPMRFRSLRVFSVLLDYPEVSVAGEVYFTARRSSAEVQEILLKKRGYDVQLKWTSVVVPILSPPPKKRPESYMKAYEAMENLKKKIYNRRSSIQRDKLIYFTNKKEERFEDRKEKIVGKEANKIVEEEWQKAKDEMEKEWEKSKEEYRIRAEKHARELEEQKRREDNVQMTDEERKTRIESWREDIRKEKEEQIVYWIGERSYRTRIK